MGIFIYHKKYLFRQIAKGNEQSFREVFHDCNKQIYPFVLKLTRSEEVSKDIIQETFLRLWINRQEVSEMDRPVSWLYTVASNQAFSWLRSHAAAVRRIQKMELKAKTEREKIVEDLSAKEVRRMIEQAVCLLPPKRQQIYRLSREEGLSHKAIAKELELSPHTIKNQIVSALKFIKDYLRQHSDIAISLLILLFSN